jgi:hypothetical protein
MDNEKPLHLKFEQHEKGGSVQIRSQSLKPMLHQARVKVLHMKK